MSPTRKKHRSRPSCGVVLGPPPPHHLRSEPNSIPGWNNHSFESALRQSICGQQPCVERIRFNWVPMHWSNHSDVVVVLLISRALLTGWEEGALCLIDCSGDVRKRGAGPAA